MYRSHVGRWRQVLGWASETPMGGREGRMASGLALPAGRLHRRQPGAGRAHRRLLQRNVDDPHPLGITGPLAFLTIELPAGISNCRPPSPVCIRSSRKLAAFSARPGLDPCGVLPPRFYAPASSRPGVSSSSASSVSCGRQSCCGGWVDSRRSRSVQLSWPQRGFRTFALTETAMT
jgi:hypothetical protein